LCLSLKADKAPSWAMLDSSSSDGEEILHYNNDCNHYIVELLRSNIKLIATLLQILPFLIMCHVVEKKVLLRVRSHSFPMLPIVHRI